jgi:hypothetical protein
LKYFFEISPFFGDADEDFGDRYRDGVGIGICH